MHLPSSSGPKRNRWVSTEPARRVRCALWEDVQAAEALARSLRLITA